MRTKQLIRSFQSFMMSFLLIHKNNSFLIRTTNKGNLHYNDKDNIRQTLFSINNENSRYDQGEYDEDKAKQTKIGIKIKQLIPNCTPKQVKDAFLEYTWKRGGGLPTLVILSQNDTQRLLLPTFFQEVLVSEKEEEEVTSITYQINKWGILSWDAIENSHLGLIELLPTYSQEGEKSTLFLWNVSFQVHTRFQLWSFVAQTFVSEAARNLISYITAQPLTYRLETTLKIPKQFQNTNLLNEILTFFWIQGGGLPQLFPPVILPNDKSSRFIIPPFLKESLIDVDFDSNRIMYKVENPSYATLFPVYSHSGMFQLASIQNSTTASTEYKLTWEVEIRPYYEQLYPYVKFFISSVISTIVRNLQNHLAFPDDKVAVKPPTGFTDQALFEMRRDSWLGNVFYSHLNDDRDAFEQSLDLVRPWTWGTRENLFEIYETWSDEKS